MMKVYKYPILAFVAVLLFAACDDYKEVDWTPYYNTQHTEPYGLYIFNEEIEKITPPFTEVKRQNRGVASYYKKAIEDTELNSEGSNTYLYIDEDNKMNESSRKRMLDLAYAGNHVFIASHDLEDTEFTNYECFNYEVGDYLDYESDTIIFSSFSSAKKAITAKCDKIRGMEYFSIVDTSWAHPLGYYQKHEGAPKRCNFMAMRYGDGIIFLHTNPEVFTNYFLLKGKNAAYTEDLISHFKKSEINWFVNYKYEFEENYGMLTYIMNQPALRTAWYLLWILLIFVVFTYAKRMQRIIPVVLPKRNYSVDYAKRLAQFHLLEKNYQGLIDKQILILLDKLRNEHRMDISIIDENFAEKMHLATNCDRLAAQDFVRYIIKNRARSVAFVFDFEELRQIVNKLNL